MVYPIAALPYSSQRRMRELAQPRELYHLQLADIDDTLYLNPLQLVRHDSMFARYRRNGRARATEPLTDTEFQEKTMLILIDDIVMLKEIFSSSVFEDSKLQYYKFESGKVGLSNCIINVGVLNGLKTWIPNCPDFFFYVCSIEEGVTLASIINTYPMATSLRFSSCQLPDNFLIGLKSVLKTEKACKVRIICQNQPNWLNKNIAADIVDFLWTYNRKTRISLKMTTGLDYDVLKEMFHPLSKELFGPHIRIVKGLSFTVSNVWRLKPSNVMKTVSKYFPMVRWGLAFFFG